MVDELHIPLYNFEEDSHEELLASGLKSVGLLSDDRLYTIVDKSDIRRVLVRGTYMTEDAADSYGNLWKHLICAYTSREIGDTEQPYSSGIPLDQQKTPAVLVWDAEKFVEHDSQYHYLHKHFDRQEDALEKIVYLDFLPQHSYSD